MSWKAEEHEQCGISTTIADQVSFGSGNLSFNGYWEVPCHLCAAHFSHKMGLSADKVWPEPDIEGLNAT